MDPLFMATSLFRRRRFEECVKTCTEILERNPYDQVRANRQHKDTIRIFPMPLPTPMTHRQHGFLRLVLSQSRHMLMRWSLRRKGLQSCSWTILQLLM